MILSMTGRTLSHFEVLEELKDGKTEDLLVGDDTPTGGGSFVKLKNDPRVFSVFSGLKWGDDKSSKDLRDKLPLTFDSDKLTRLELQAKGQTVEFGKNNQNEWQILKPKPLRADGSQVEDLIRKLKLGSLSYIVVFFASLIFFGLFLTARSMESLRWRA
jgi:hypothetical protein